MKLNKARRKQKIETKQLASKRHRDTKVDYTTGLNGPMLTGPARLVVYPLPVVYVSETIPPPRAERSKCATTSVSVGDIVRTLRLIRVPVVQSA